MKTAIIGNSQSEKEELFSLVTGIGLDQITEKPLESHIGTCNVKDPRIAKLISMYNPKKTTYVKIEYLLLPNLDMEGPTKKLIMDNLKNADEICFVVKEVSAKKEIADLPESDQQEFMKELGIDEPAVNKMNRLTYEGLGLISYFTVGEDEVRAWTVRRGALAPEAGAAIHTDIQKGFVKAEMFKYNDLTEAGSETKLKELGKFHLKGRDYLVEDGDILSFRFNV